MATRIIEKFKAPFSKPSPEKKPKVVELSFIYTSLNRRAIFLPL